MKLDRNVRIATVAALALGASVTTAAADTSALHINGAGPDPIIVLSNGQEYTKIKQLGMFSINTNLIYDTGTAGRINSYWVEPRLTAGYGIASQLPFPAAYRVSHSYSVGNRPKSINKPVVLSVPLAVMNNLVVGMCNWKANSLRQDGKSNQQIFADDHEVTLKADAEWHVEASGAGSNNVIKEATFPRDVKVICQKWQGSQIPQGPSAIAPAAMVEHATLMVKPQSTLNGQCKVKLTGMVRLNRANYPVKVRFQHTSGALSEILSFNTAGNMIGLVNRMVDIPQVAGAETGAFRMIVIEPDGGTGYTHYSMNCADIGGFQAQPSQPPAGPNQLKPKDLDAAPSPRLQLKLKTN